MIDSSFYLKLTVNIGASKLYVVDITDMFVCSCFVDMRLTYPTYPVKNGIRNLHAWFFRNSHNLFQNIVTSFILFSWNLFKDDVQSSSLLFQFFNFLLPLQVFFRSKNVILKWVCQILVLLFFFALIFSVYLWIVIRLVS